MGPSMEMWFERKLGASLNVFVFVNLGIQEGSECMPQEWQKSAVNAIIERLFRLQNDFPVD